MVHEAERLGGSQVLHGIRRGAGRGGRLLLGSGSPPLIGGENLPGPEITVIGDGKVEMALGREASALTIGVASDEERREGVNQVKRAS